MPIAALAAIVLAAGPTPARALDYDCADFANQAEAEAYLLPGDPYRLDADHDGIACEDLPCPCASGAPSVPAPPSIPAPAPPSIPAPTPTPAPPVEEEPEPVAYEAYVACSRGQYAPAASHCRQGSKIGAFLRSSQAVSYSVCVRFPTGRELCAREQQAEAGTLYVNAVTTRALGRHKVIWQLPDRRIVRSFQLEG